MDQCKKDCDCRRISVQFQVETSVDIFGTYKRMDGHVNNHYHYESEAQESSHGIWFCERYGQWIIGLIEEKGSCQGYAYTNSTSDCFLCNYGFGWRFFEYGTIVNNWVSISPSAIQISCSYKGTQFYLIIFLKSNLKSFFR